MQEIESEAVSKNSKAPGQSPSPRAEREKQAKGPERFTPNQLMLLFILVFLASEAGGIFLESFLKQGRQQGAIFIHIAEIFLFLAATLLLIYLPLKRRLVEREKVVAAMRESEQQLQHVMQEREQHLRLALEGTNSGLWDWDLVAGQAYYSPSGERLLGYLPGELDQSIKTWETLLNPEDREQVMKRLHDHLEGRSPSYESEHRVRSKSGEWFWFHALGRVTSRDQAGRPLRILGMFNNVTDRKKAEAEIHRLWQSLDRAGEHERARLAHDLHDQLGQIVTGLQFGLGVLKRDQVDHDQVDQCQKLIDLTAQLSNEIRSVTSRLRPPALDSGLVPALEFDLKRLRRHLPEHRITLHVPGMERERLEPEAEISLFRVYQEALNNAVKHARTRKIDIRLQRKGSEIILAVKDDGSGFDVKQVLAADKEQQGIGLLGMQERVAALSGHLEIISQPGRGTTVMAILPCRPHEQRMSQ